MPIKEENKKLYPENWKEIREAILKRANNKCEFCGVENHALGFRNYKGEFIKLNENPKDNDEDDVLNNHIFRIVLTIAHLDHNPENNNSENLRALCQKCHLNYDKEHHAETRRKTKELKSGQLKLIKEQTNEK